MYLTGLIASFDQITQLSSFLTNFVGCLVHGHHDSRPFFGMSIPYRNRNLGNLTKLPRLKGVPERSYIFQVGAGVFQLFMFITFLPLWHVIRFLALNNWRVTDPTQTHERDVSFSLALLILSQSGLKKDEQNPNKKTGEP